MEEKDIIEKVITKLNADDIWFTQKTDPTVEEAHNYYKLNEYGEPTEATIKNIVKEVNDLIGNGAVGIDDAIDLWESDQMIAYRLDYKDNLVTKFEPKPVIDNIEVYENPVQFPQSKKVEGRKITEGVLKNIQLEDEIDEWKVYSADVDTKLGKNIIDTFKNYEDDEGNVITNIRIDYNTSNNKYIVNYVDNNGRFHQIDYKLSDDELSQIAGSKKVEAKTKKTEGAGAGYHIGGIINIENINSFKIISQEGPDNYGDITVTVDCDVDVTLTEMSAFSYYYGNDINVDVPAKVTGLIVKISEDDKQNDIGVDESSIKELLDGTKFKTLIGGGWTHTTFTGGMQVQDSEITDSEYYYSYFTEIDIQISDENIIKYIDKVVEGENFYTEFLVYDKDGDIISDEFTAEEADYSAVDKAQDDAIEFAEANKGVRVVKQTYRELADGDLDGYDTEPEVVWEREYTKNYKFDDEVEESKKISEAKAENFTEDDYKKFCKFWVEANDDNYVDFEGNEPEEPPIRYYPHEDEDDSYLFHSFRDMFNDLEIGEAILMDYEDGQVDELNKAGITEGDIKKLDKQFNYGLNEKTEEDAIAEYMKNEGASSGYTADEAVVTYFDNPIPMTEAKKTGATFDDKVKAIKKSLKKKDGRLSDETAEEQAKKIAGSMIKKENFRSYKKDETVNFNNRTKEKIDEDYQKRLDEVNNKSQNIISDMFTSSDFDSDTPAGQIVMRTSEVFNALSDKGYDVDVAFDNGESTSAIQLGQQGGKVMITITNADQPLRAFTVGNFEVNDDNIKILQDIQDQISVL